MKYLCVIVLVFLYDVRGDASYYKRLDALTPEQPCNQAGGICVFAEDCPKLTGVSGQCPKQKALGVECCYGVSVRDTRCQKNGGDCFSKGYCSGDVHYKKATDCKQDEMCCILLH